MNVTENYFKALGWELRVHKISGNDNWWTQEGVWVGRLLPNITQSFPDFKKWVLEKMEGEGFTPSMNYCFQWENDFHESRGLRFIREIIKDNEITWAAVEAATKYFESIKG